MPKRKKRARTESPGAALVAFRWKKTPPAERSAIARKLAQIRWKKKGRRGTS